MNGNLIFGIGIVIIGIASCVFWSSYYNTFNLVGICLSLIIYMISAAVTMFGMGLQQKEYMEQHKHGEKE